MSWTPERVRAAAARWVWVPPDAREVATGEYHLVAYPEYYLIPTQVAWCRSGRPAAELVEEVAGHVRGWGRPDVSFWVGQDTRPDGLADTLRALGAEHVESVDVLAWDLTGPLPDTASFAGRVRSVDDEGSLRSAYAVEAEVWGQEPPDDERIAQRLAELTAPGADELRVVAELDGRPVATGGGTLAEGGAVLRLWGAGTVPAARGRGAYQAVLAARLTAGRERGAEVALVKAVTTTSSPILRHLGFASHGREDRWCLPVAPPPPSDGQ